MFIHFLRKTSSKNRFLIKFHARNIDFKPRMMYDKHVNRLDSMLNAPYCLLLMLYIACLLEYKPL